MSSDKTIELDVGTVVDQRYRVTGRIGQGGMGTVYEAEQVKLQRSIALKVLRPEFAEKEKAAKRFEREAKAASSIDHRNVVKILDFGNLPSGELYYTMERLQGRDLAQILRESGALPWSRAGWIILQVVRAFGAIHGQGIVHRDIKPANCFLVDPKPGDEPDLVKILDFGIANLQDERTKATALTGADDIIGSVRYMAPEQISADAIDARTDVYSLGVMMYELLTGQVPFRDTSVYKVMIAHKQEDPQPPHELVPDIPVEVEAVVLRAMQKDPEERFQSMAELEAALLPLVQVPGTLGGATTPQLTGAGLTFVSRRGQPKWLVPVIASLVFFVAAIAVTRWFKQADDEPLAQADAATPDGADSGGGDADEATPSPKRTTILPPPEEQYDPFADPFGAPSLQGRVLRRPAAGAEGETEGIPAEEVPLEDLLPPEAWLLERGTISGQVLDDQERPLAAASVCAWIVDPRAPVELRKRPACARTDRRGRFELTDVVPGLHDVNVFKDRFLPQSYLELHQYPVALQPGGAESGLAFTLQPGGAELRGTVKTKLGDPIRGAKVAVVGGPRTLAVADDSGAFTLWVAQEDVSVVAWANGYADVVTKGRAGQPLAVTLDIQAKLLGIVIDADSGEPVGGARVRAGRQGGGVNPLTYTNASGEFEISGLSEGRYQPTARTDDAYGQLGEPQRISEGTATSEVIIKTHRFKVEVEEPAPVPAPVAEPEPVPAGSTGGMETEGEGSSSGGDGAETAAEPEPEPVAVADPTPPPAEEPKPPAAADTPKPKPQPTDRSLRRELAMRLKRCGTDGTIEISAKLVLASGELLQDSVTVKGAAASDPSVKKCAEGHLSRFKLTRRKEPTTFEPMTVKI
ncbi:MAG: protein kinase [Myxococcales bacterium]|nr:protein kinase [Myxococcales bacterium]